MRSETSSLLDWIMVGCGVVVIALAVFGAVNGRVTVTRTYVITRDESPGAFWAWVGGFTAIGVAIVIISLPNVMGG